VVLLDDGEHQQVLLELELETSGLLEAS